MRLVAVAAVLVLAIALGSCTAIGIGIYGGALWLNHVFSIAPVYGSDLDGVSASADGDLVTVHLAYVPEDGKFLRLLVPEDQTSTGESWTGDSDTLHLIAPTPLGIDIGVVQRPSYEGGPAELKLQLGPESKNASTPPMGLQNAVRDLTVVEIGSGRVRLEWTEINIGDYDLNDQVNIADLTPLGKYFGSSEGDANWELASVADGDENHDVSMSDITPIGLHYLEALAGYVIQRNGEDILNDQGGLPTISRQPSPGLSQHPVYSVEVDGDVSDTWSVAPMDSQEQAGPVAQPAVIDRMDLSVNLVIHGLDLLKLDGSGSGPYGPGYSLLRVIDDIDWPSRCDPSVGKGIATAGGPNETVFNDVPRGRPLLLDIHYAPVKDLADNTLKTSSTARGVSAVPDNDQVITSVPFTLAPGSQQMRIDVDINLLPVNPGVLSQGYFVDLTYTVTTLGNTQSISLRLRCSNGLVATDHNSDGYLNDPALLDSDRDCISNARMEQFEDYTTFAGGTMTQVRWKGKVINLDEEQGLIVCDDVEDYHVLPPMGYYPSLEGPRVVHFTEFARFTDESGGVPGIDINPLVTQSKVVRVIGYFWTNGPGPAKYWAETIARDPSY